MYKLINILISVINTGKVVKLFRHILHPKGIHCHKCGSKKIKEKIVKINFQDIMNVNVVNILVN